MTSILALVLPTAFNFIHFIVGFLLLICVIAVVIIGVRWLAALAGVAIPPPLMAILGILLFVVLLLLLLNWSGLSF
jgi:Na+/alanine symporter